MKVGILQTGLTLGFFWVVYALIGCASFFQTGVDRKYPIPAIDSLKISWSVFGDHQLFWKSSDSAGRAPLAPTRLGIYPVWVSEYWERIPCDSCHRLSANALEFQLDQYFLRSLEHRVGETNVQLLAPHLDILKARNIKLEGYFIAEEFPFQEYHDGFHFDLIYRPADRFTPASLRAKLDTLSGAYGLTHLLLPLGIRVKVFPDRTNDHFGAMELGFDLLLWDAAKGGVAWAARFHRQWAHVDLDKAWDGYLNELWLESMERLPAELTQLREAEPK